MAITSDKRANRIAEILREHPGDAGVRMVSGIFGIEENLVRKHAAQIREAGATTTGVGSLAADQPYSAHDTAKAEQLAAEVRSVLAKPLTKATIAELSSLAAASSWF